jgi:hypothetical protein
MFYVYIRATKGFMRSLVGRNRRGDTFGEITKK